MKTFINWLLIPLLLLMPAWYRSLKDTPKLPPGVKAADDANRTKTAAKAAVAEEAAAVKGARAMSTRGLMTGAGLAATVAFLLWPEISDAVKSKPQPSTTSEQKEDQRRFERQARAAQDVTATEEDEREDRRRVSDKEDRHISAEKNYRPPDAWRWKYEADAPRNIACEWVPMSPEWEEYVCHTRFEEPPPGYHPYPHGYQPGPKSSHQPRHGPQPQFVRYGPNVTACSYRRGGCPYNGG